MPRASAGAPGIHGQLPGLFCVVLDLAASGEVDLTVSYSLVSLVSLSSLYYFCGAGINNESK